MVGYGQTTSQGEGKTDFKARLTLVDGTVIDGYLRTSLWDRPSSVGISEEKKGKIKKYKPEEVKELVVNGDEGSWTGLMAQRMPSLWNKNPGPYKKKVFLMQVYVGKNIKAYVMPITTYTPGRTMKVRGCAFKYYVIVNGEDVARYFWYDSGALTIGAKSALKLYFKDYPKMVEMIDKTDKLTYPKSSTTPRRYCLYSMK